MVQEGSAGRIAVTQWPAQAVHHKAFLVLVCWDFPDLFEANTVMLRVLAGIQRELLYQLLAKVAPASLGK